MDLKGLQLASRLAMSPNQLGYCGHDTAGAVFHDCILHDNCQHVEAEIKNFIVLNPYLQTISKILKKPLTSLAVVEAYWLGNSHLRKIKQSDYSLLLDNFAIQGVPPWLIAELRQTPPQNFIPTHLFQVLHVGVGRASGSVPYNLDSINNCMVRWGTVQSISDHIVVELNSLDKKDNTYKLVKKIATVKFDPELLLGISVGQTIIVHWGWAVKILTIPETKKLSFWTKAVLSSF